MLRVKIEFIPSKDFWIADLWNDCSGSQTLGNYKFKIYQKNSNEVVWKGGEVKDFKRKQWSVWYLIYLCLEKIYGD